MRISNKIIISLLVIFAILNLSIANATEAHTYLDVEQGIEWSYEINASGDIVNLKCNTKNVSGKVIIPYTIEGKNVISLADDAWDDGAFEDCSGITEITMPNTITKIGNSAFKNCTGLKVVTMSNSVITIGQYAFEDCSNLTEIIFPSKLITIGQFAFQNCKELTTIIIPNSVRAIGEGAFEQCSKLSEVTLSENITMIGRYTFASTALNSIILPDSVTTIAGSEGSYDGAFRNCKKLEKILIPDSVTNIGTEAFKDCPNLTIYGNDGKTSQKYAEKKEIPFDYIANWNKEDIEKDDTKPTIKEILVSSDSLSGCNIKQEQKTYLVTEGVSLVIKVRFSEPVKGTIVPTLTIKFGEGQNINLTNGVIEDTTILYTYTIQSSDNGIMKIVNYSGGDFIDSAGNSLLLTCPALQVQYGEEYDYSICANGTITNTDDEIKTEDTQDKEDVGSNTEDTQDKGNVESNTEDDTHKEPDTVPGILPNAGNATVTLIVIMIIVMLVAGLVSFIKIKQLKEK